MWATPEEFAQSQGPAMDLILNPPLVNPGDPVSGST